MRKSKPNAESAAEILKNMMGESSVESVESSEEGNTSEDENDEWDKTLVKDLPRTRMKKMDSAKVRKEHPPAPVHLWQPKPEEIMIDYEGRICKIHFEKVFNVDNPEKCNQFIIVKDAFKNKLELICLYLNYFIAKYDYENEFMTAYLNMQYAVNVNDDEKPNEIHFGKDDVDTFIQYIYEVLFTPTIVDKVCAMVEENYLDDIEKEDSATKRGVQKEKRHLESLEFTNEQVKIMLRISLGMKMMCPIMFQYMAVNNIKPDKKSNLLFRFFFPLFTVFTPPGVDIYNKLFVYVRKKVMESKSTNEKIFKMREILGVDEYTVISMFVRNVVLSDNFVKLMFSCQYNPNRDAYVENVPGFLKTVIKVQFFYFLKISHQKTFTELTSTKNADGLSGVDKLEMASDKIDEGNAIIEEACAWDALQRLRKKYNFGITEEEIDFYEKNWRMSPMQIDLIYTYYAPMVGSYRACRSYTNREVIELAIMLRNNLLIASGFEDYRTFTDEISFPYMIMGNIDGKVNTRIIRNTKFSEDCDNSYIIQDLINKQYNLLEEIDGKSVMMLLSKLNNTVFTYCVYERPDLLETQIDMERANVTDSVGYFLRSIQ